MEVEFNYTINKTQKGVIWLNRFQYEGICILNQDLVLNGYEPIELEESIPLTHDKNQLKDLIKNQAKRIVQNTVAEYPNDYSEDLVKDVLRDKFYHKFEHPTFLFNDLCDTQLITKDEIESYKKKLNALKYLLDELI